MKVLLPTVILLLLTVFPVAADDCVDCHSRETPAAVAQWRASAHVDKVGCADCHGEDHDRTLRGEALVDAAVCGRCHEQAYGEHVSSKHGMGLHSGWGCTRNLKDRDLRECRFCHEEGSTRPKTTVQCARFLTQSAEVRSLGCNRCHQVESSCASCHTNHITDLAAVRRPEVCATCHMGPDHPQREMWQTSRHGILYATLGESAGPTCQTCHMAQGSHDVSSGITMSPAMEVYPSDERERQRAGMLALCTMCHASGFATRELTAGDAILAQSRALVAEAEAIIRDLADHDLLAPSLRERPEHPLRGRELVLDGQMLYEETSHIERLFFKMKKYDLAKTVKGAYHQNPAYMHWYGNAELKMTLTDIRAEAARLRQGRGGAGSVAERDGLSSAEEKLRALKRKHERGALGDEEYRLQREDLLRGLSPSRVP